MPDITTVEGLMIFLINTFSEKFPQSAILKGGMCLRLLDCPRLTNDIDYVFIPYSSKKDILKGVLAVLDEIDGLTYEYSLNSKCLRIRVQYGELTTQIEVNVAKECSATSISTVGLARQFGLLGRVVQVTSYDVAMANKLAAWNERLLARDLYDLYFFYAMVQAMPNMKILEKRLEQVASTPRNKNPKQMTLEQLVSKLRDRLASLSTEDMLELADYLPSNEIQGL
jgi:predicted nucleotidyltransferase component of viral defense system